MLIQCVSVFTDQTDPFDSSRCSSYCSVASTHSMSTDLRNKSFTNFVIFPMDGTEDDALFDSGTDTEYSVLGETYCDLGLIFAHSDSSDEEILGLE